MTTPALITDLMADEGCRLEAYQDTLGNWTIGYGHTPANEGEVWTLIEAQGALASDVGRTLGQLDVEIPWWRTLNDARQDALANMAFNLGVGGLLEFRHMLASLQAGDWIHASAQMLLSKWASEVGLRATRLAAMMRSGVRP